MTDARSATNDRYRGTRLLLQVAAAIVATTAFSSAAFSQTVENARYCSNTAANTILYLDTTTPYDATDEAELVTGISHIFDSLEDGGRLSIRTIEDLFSKSERLLDMCEPYCQSNGFLADLFSSCTEGVVINDKKRLRLAIRQTISQRVRQSVELPYSEIIRTLAMSAREEYRAGRSNTIYVFSDMIENSPYIGGRTFFSTLTDALLARVGKDGLIPDLAGANVHVFGFGRSGVVGDRHALPQGALTKLRAFWTGYFQAAGATLSLEQNFTTAD